MILKNTIVQRKNSDDDNLIPLINIVFLMLIFFMVAGQIQPSDGIKIESPTSVSDTKLTPERLKVVISEDGQLFIDGAQLEKDDFGSRVLAYVQTLTPEQKENAAVVIKADGNLTVDSMQDYVKTIKTSGITHISLMTQPSEQASL
jgi:biopolymer transport protein ExbD